MQTNNHQIVDYDMALEARYGKEGTPEHQVLGYEKAPADAGAMKKIEPECNFRYRNNVV